LLVLRNSRIRLRDTLVLSAVVFCARDLVGKPEGKRPLGRHRSRRKDNIKMDLQGVGCGVVDRI
jgi:hypothetical protein